VILVIFVGGGVKIHQNWQKMSVFSDSADLYKKKTRFSSQKIDSNAFK
jgi:hypothetical protein